MSLLTSLECLVVIKSFGWVVSPIVQLEDLQCYINGVFQLKFSLSGMRAGNHYPMARCSLDHGNLFVNELLADKLPANSGGKSFSPRVVKLQM